MESVQYYLNGREGIEFLNRISRGTVYATIEHNGQIGYEKIVSLLSIQPELTGLPPIESVKSFYFPARERVAVYGNCEYSTPSEAEPESIGYQTIIGARTCDLSALKVMDRIFLDQEFHDPFYESRRKNTLLVTVDCVQPGEYCFCNLVGGQPWPLDGYQVHLSPIEGGYLVSFGNGVETFLLDSVKTMLSMATDHQIAQKESNRAGALERLKTWNRGFTPLTSMNDIGAIEDWGELSCSCVECGACSYVCPTCHCFLLFDQRARSVPEIHIREKSWDSCLLANYAKMAGVGGMKPTPRPELRNRFENRIRHKFEWMVQNLGLIGCVGCGRCRSACLGGSDIRAVIEELHT